MGEKAKRALIVAASRINDAALVEEAARADVIICADGGYTHAKRAGVKIDYAIGDFDSLGFVPTDCEVRSFPARKDDTDLVLALRLCAELQVTEAAALGCLGGRFDHSFAAAVSAAFAKTLGINLTVSDESTEVLVIQAGLWHFEKTEKDYLSLFCLTESAQVRYSGFEYSGDVHLTSTFPLGVSNRILGGAASIFVESGTIIVIRSSGD